MVEALYEQIAREIAEQIKSGVLKPSEKLPSTAELREIYKCSETVIRFAMIKLKAENLVVGKPGLGVFVV